MKFVYALIVCLLGMSVSAAPQFKLPPPDNKINLPTLTGSGGGSSRQGFDINLNAQQKVWESQNGRHSIDATGGYSQHLGGPYGNSRPDYRVGAGYTFKFG